MVTIFNVTDSNAILEKLAEIMSNSVCQYDLSNETVDKFDNLADHAIDDEFYQYALNELISNIAKSEFEIAQSEIELDDFQLRSSLHAACDKFLQTEFF